MSLLEKKILYVIEGFTGFKKLDEKILQSLAKTRTYNYKSFIDYINLNLLFKVIWSDIIIIWFASKHAIPIILLNMIFKRPLIIIAGGFDVASLSSINYGAMRDGSRKQLGNWILSKATKVVSVSKSNFKEILRNTNVSRSKIKLIYNASPPIIKHNFKKKLQVLTVGEINKETFYRKGLDRFIKIAKNMLDVEFYHIGKWSDVKGRENKTFFDYVESISPANIKYLGYLKEDQLISFYKYSKIYIQLSRHEAFGVSVLEALSYNCIPIVSNAFSLPEVVKGNGYVVKSISEAIKITRYALNLKSYKINKEYLERFSVESRKKSFKKLLSL